MSMLYDLKSKFLAWGSNIRIYPGGIVLWGDSHYKIKGPHMREILDVIEPGDILLRRYDHYVGSVLIKGYWSHSAVYTGVNHEIVHMIGQGASKEDILTFMRCDDLLVLRHKNKTPEMTAEAIRLAYNALDRGVEYDNDFDATDDDKQFCTEFTDWMYKYPVLATLPKGTKIIFPDDYLNWDIFDIIWGKKDDLK